MNSWICRPGVSVANLRRAAGCSQVPRLNLRPSVPPNKNTDWRKMKVKPDEESNGLSLDYREERREHIPVRSSFLIISFSRIFDAHLSVRSLRSVPHIVSSIPVHKSS